MEPVFGEQLVGKEVNCMWTQLGMYLETWMSQLRAEEGQTFVEYALLVVVIALVAVLGATFLGNSVSSLFSSIAGHL